LGPYAVQMPKNGLANRQGRHSRYMWEDEAVRPLLPDCSIGNQKSQIGNHFACCTCTPLLVLRRKLS